MNEELNIEGLLSEVNEDKLFQIIKTDQSLHEGTGLVKDYVKKAKELGVKNLVLAERNTISSIVKFYKSCKEHQINPIIGNTLRLDLPILDIERNLIKNQKSLEILQSFLNENNININLKSLFKTEVGFKSLEEINKSVEKFMKSDSKTKDIIFIKEVNTALTSAAGTPLFLLSDLVINEVAKGFKIGELKSISDGIAPYINLQNFCTCFEEFDLKLETTDILVIAQNKKGYSNIKELVSEAFLEGQGKIELNKTKTKRRIDSFPLVTMEQLRTYKEGLKICLGDAEDALGKSIIKSGQTGERVIKYFQEELGESLMLYVKKSTKGDMNKYLVAEEILNTRLIELSDLFGIPCVGTHDARFINKEDYFIHDIKRAILLKENIDAFSRVKTEFKGQHLISPEEMIHNFKDYPELLLNNNAVSENSTLKLRLGKNVLPQFSIDDDFARNTLIEHGKNLDMDFSSMPLLEIKNELKSIYFEEIKNKFPEEEWEEEVELKVSNIIAGNYMKDIGWKGVEEKMLVKLSEEEWSLKRQEYLDRFNFEANVINEMGFPGYFLIVQEFIRWGKERGVPVGPGRGSGAGSIMAFGLSITTIDPIKDDLLFERFLNPERVSMPDFDIDFGAGFDESGNPITRDDVIEHVKDFYKNLNSKRPTVGQIATNGEFAIKSSIKKVAKVLGHTITFETALMKLVDSIYSKPDLKFDFLFEDEEFMNRYENEPQFRRIIDISKKLKGNKQNSGVHAGGVVISPTTSSLSEFSSVQCSHDGKGLVIQLDKNDSEEVGLVKFDFLGLETLSVIQETLKRVNGRVEVPVNIDFIPEDDALTFSMLSKALTHGIFQIESAGMTKLVEELQVNNIGSISDLLALYRPGPMQAGMMDDYVIVRKKILDKHKETGIPINDIGILDIDVTLFTKEEKDAFSPIHLELMENLNPTNNQMIYQEQVMKAGQILAGYSLGQADMLRRAMGKKKMSEMIIHKKMFAEGAFNNFREHFKEKTLNSPIGMELDISLTDIAERLNIVNYLDYSKENNTSYFSTENKIIDFFKEYLGYTEADVADLSGSIADYKVEDFKRLHMLKIKDKMSQKSKELGLSSEEEKIAFFRTYYALTQFVRFNNVFSAIEKFAAYGFNKSHSLAYANISYQTAYLKANYTEEFIASSLTFHHGELEKISMTVADARKNFGIKILGASVNESENLFKPIPDKKSVRYGLSAIKGLGSTANIIYKERVLNGEYKDLPDLLYRVAYRNAMEGAKNIKIDVTGISGLAYSGAIEELLPNCVRNNKDIVCKKTYILKQYEKICDAGIFPKRDKLIKMVEHRIKTGSYKRDMSYFDISQYDQNLSDKEKVMLYEIAYTKSSEILGKTKAEKGISSLNEKVDDILEKIKIGFIVEVKEVLYDKLKENTNADLMYTLLKEKEFTGIYIGAHPVNVNNLKASMSMSTNAVLHDMNQIVPEKQGNMVRVIGVLNEIREVVVKNGQNAGQKMAILTLEDETDNISITIFADGYKLAKNALEINSLFAFDAEVSYSEQYGLALNAKSIQKLLPMTPSISLEKKNNASLGRYN